MDYVGSLFRPPSEGRSMIIQVTVGCSHNQCTFCGAYKEKQFYIKDMATIKKDIDEAAQYREHFDKVFLADGDVLIMPPAQIIEILSYIREKCGVKRIGVYPTPRPYSRSPRRIRRSLKGRHRDQISGH
jgi:radical SAM superfamily enzyme YgiQ (UPF0313 family)